MRCPKCHYISFEAADRCRHCGYDFSLTPPGSAAPDEALPLHDRDEAPLPPVDLSLAQVEGLDKSDLPDPERGFDLERIAPRATPFDLPLFGGPSADGPLVKAPAVPRPPLAVRRATPDAQRLRARYPVADVPRLDLEPGAKPVVASASPPVRMALAQPIPAPVVRRALAGAIDILLLAGINLGVVYFTLKLCALPITGQALLSLPLVPLGVFLLMLDGGYFVTFTAVVGQTIGKMATGLRVVRTSDHGDQGEQIDSPDLGSAVLRTAAYAASLLPAGLGFLPALLGRDRRALHDRLAETRVVKI